MPPLIIAAGIVAGASVGTAMYQSHEERVQQKKILTRQEDQAAAAEQKARGAEALAKQQAKDTIRKKRLAQTNTILTSPLGVPGEANTQKNVLLGG